jgi:hypothetical protein
MACVTKEHDWQSSHITSSLQPEVLNRVVVQKFNREINIKLQKGEDF